MTSPNMMYAGGPGGDPYMGLLGNVAPQTSGLLQVPQQQLQTLSPMTQGLQAPTPGLMQMPQLQTLPPMSQQTYQPQSFGSSPGTNWSQVAYQMAGSPNQNPFRGSVLPPVSTAATSPSGGGATALGGTALGILGALGKALGGTNSPLGSAISGLMGNNGNPFGTYTTGNIANVGNVPGNSITSSYAPGTAQYTSGLMGDAANAAGASGIVPVGTGAIDASADAGANAAIPGLEANSNENSFGTYTSGNIANVGNVPGSDITNSYAPDTAQYTSGLMSGAANDAGISGIVPVGTGAIDAAADAGASAAIPGLEGSNGISLGGAVGAGGDALGIVNGLSSGSPMGYAGAAVDAGKLAQQAGLLGSGASPILGDAGGALGLIGGIQQGGVAGDTNAALSATQLGSQAGLFSPGMGAGAGALGLALAPAIIGMSTPAVQLTGKYWGGVQNSLQQAIASGDRGQIAAQVQGLLAQPQNQIPANIQQLVYSTGFVPKTGWGQGPTMANPSLAAGLTQQTGGFKGGNSGGNNKISVDRA